MATGHDGSTDHDGGHDYDDHRCGRHPTDPDRRCTIVHRRHASLDRWWEYHVIHPHDDRPDPSAHPCAGIELLATRPDSHPVPDEPDASGDGPG